MSPPTRHHRLLLATLLTTACATSAADPQAISTVESPAPESAAPESPAPEDADLREAGVTIGEAFPPPADAVRVETDAFGTWLRHRPLAHASAPVQTHDGRVVQHRARVVDMALVKGDLQQCADSILRLRAEWLRETGQPISFHATSGDPMPWSRFQAGERPYVSGRNLAWRGGKGPASWDLYLGKVFTWAGTLSLKAHETEAVSEPRGGDVLVEGGSPGHAVLLLDVAVGPDDVTYLLVGEGFMPAQDFHIELGPHDGWWTWTEAGLELPHWPLGRDSLRRFPATET